MIDINQLKAEVLLAPFRATIGESHWDAITHECDCYLGAKAKDVQIKQGGWKAGTKGKIVSKAGYSVQLDLNNGMTGLVMVALRLQEISLGGSTKDYSMIIESAFPVDVESWFQRKYREGKAVGELQPKQAPEELLKK